MTEATIPTTEPAVESQVADDTEAEAVVQASTEEEPKETEELSEEPVQTPKASASKRRSIFNPFGKSKEEVEAIPTESIENKKKAKGFGSFFSRSKSAPKVNEDVHAELAPVPTELPQIEKLQPIETVDVTEDANNSEQVLESKKTESEPEATEAHAEEQVEAQLNIPTTNKRQSFISKIFSKKKQDDPPKETSGGEEVTAEAITEAPKVETPDDIEHGETHEEEKEEGRPSSPLGRLTELFTKKRKSKTPAVPDTTEEVSAESDEEHHEKTEEDPNDTEDVQESTQVEASPAVVVASA